MSFLPDTALDPLEQIAEESLTDTVVLLTPTRVDLGGMKYRIDWTPLPAEPGLLVPASQGGTNIRADAPSVAGDWVLKLRKGSTADEKMRATVTGITDEGEAWSRLVALTKLLFPRTEILREVLCTDVEPGT